LRVYVPERQYLEPKHLIDYALHRLGKLIICSRKRTTYWAEGLAIHTAVNSRIQPSTQFTQELAI